MFDEETGKVMVDRVGLPVVRPGLTPCECSVGCPKGHWRDNPDLIAGEEAVVRLWQSGHLTDAERADTFLSGAIAALSEQQARIDKRSQDELILALVTMRK
jgi:hypothetical protein